AGCGSGAWGIGGRGGAAPGRVARPGEPYRLRVEARFADGSTEVVPSYCSFESLDAPTAAVDPSGQVTPRGVGDVALIVRYRGQPAMARVLVPRPGNTPFPDVTPNNAIDN